MRVGRGILAATAPWLSMAADRSCPGDRQVVLGRESDLAKTALEHVHLGLAIHARQRSYKRHRTPADGTLGVLLGTHFKTPPIRPWINGGMARRFRKLGQCLNQTRPRGVETGQYPTGRYGRSIGAVEPVGHAGHLLSSTILAECSAKMKEAAD